MVADDSSRIVTAGVEHVPPRTADGADALEAALARALDAAATAGRFDVVAQLARELEARRLARGDGKVVVLDAARERSAKR